MNIMILGASGNLGSRLYELLHQDYEVFGTFYNSGIESSSMIHWLGDPILLLEILKQYNPDVIINCVGLTDVDLCENLPEKAFHLNALIPYHVSKICVELNIKFVHISTDHFEGDQLLPSTEKSLVVYPNLYSSSKMIGESFIQLVNSNSIILRTNFFHFNSNARKSFVDRCLNDPVTFQNIGAFDDIFFTPISTQVLKTSIVKLLDLNFNGVINISSNEMVSKYMFMKEIFAILQIKDRKLYPKKIAESHLLANRPKNMALSNDKFRKLTLSHIPSVSEMIRSELEYSKFI